MYEWQLPPLALNVLRKCVNYNCMINTYFEYRYNAVQEVTFIFRNFPPSGSHAVNFWWKVDCFLSYIIFLINLCSFCISPFGFLFAGLFKKINFHTHIYILQHTDNIFGFGHCSSSGEWNHSKCGRCKFLLYLDKWRFIRKVQISDNVCMLIEGES